MSDAPRLWSGSEALVTLVAVSAPLVATILQQGPARLVFLALGLGLATFWHLVFARIRRRWTGWDGLVTAAIFAVLVPEALPLWQQGLALSFGLVMGDLVFGGRGRGFLSPAAVALAFALFSFPVSAGAAPGPASAIAALAGGAALLLARVLSWRVVAGFALAMAALQLLQPGWPALPGATLILGLVFLIGDPVAAACTNAGRWVYGALAGALVALLETAGGGALSSVVFAALLAGIFASLIDQGVIWDNVRRRARRQRHG
ncbi:RnfABCDGE type electron transport complex subunit D [Citreicella sp. C3M06]|uniref:RnfABCDGE type electron transport complex subunit D n=1 Tax=Citreicella sp. C3M06 TaxID=2841564 RepID=UPI001C092C56|nr:RnfABCDGE type electron transport complex subunit D [Citreicella sp. C3M06]MBU2961316.1 RnfABCDGE type electron transport complex subunit D [Citreicella sp. C3M06]